MTTVDVEVAYALSDFVEAAKLHALGINLDDGKMQIKGCDRLRAAKNMIEKHTGSYDLLLPLLEHESEGVRFNAAFTLIDDHYDLAIPVLRALDQTSPTNMRTSGAMVLQMYGEWNRGSGPGSMNTDPERPKPRQRPVSGV